MTHRELSGLVDAGRLHHLLLVLDLAGTFVFAISGALVGIKQRLDLFGVLALSFVASSAGGITRDLMIGAVPPAAIADWRYFAVAVAAGGVMFLWYSPLSRLHTAVQVFDAAGLALFAVAGAQKALAVGLNPLMASLLGMITGIGGGIIRDLLVARTPEVFRGDFYASAAFVGAGLVVIGGLLELPSAPTAVVAAIVCFCLRIAAIHLNWRLPTARSPKIDSDRDEAGDT